MGFKLREKEKIKAPSMWSRLGWTERIVMFAGPIFIIYIFNKILGG